MAKVCRRSKSNLVDPWQRLLNMLLFPRLKEKDRPCTCDCHTLLQFGGVKHPDDGHKCKSGFDLCHKCDCLQDCKVNYPEKK